MENKNVLNTFDKKKIAIKHLLKGMSVFEPEFNKALKAMYIAERYHTGTRKDGQTQEFLHQLEIVGNIVNNLKLLRSPAKTVIVGFLHDVVEDYGQDAKIWSKPEEAERLKGLKPFTLENVREIFGDEIARSVDAISKVTDGKKKKTEQYYDGIANDPYASVAKLEDRINNLQSMLTVFTLEKQKDYADDVVKYFMPMLKKAEKNFPEQSDMYQNLNNRLKSQIKGVFAQVEIFHNLGLSLDQVPSKAKATNIEPVVVEKRKTMAP